MLFSTLLSLFFIGASAQTLCQNNNHIYKTHGDALIFGLFEAHNGPNCSSLDFNGLHLIESSITAVEAVRKNNLLPGINIGLALYDTCSQPEMAKKSVISALLEAQCDKQFVIGGIAGDGVDEGVEVFSGPLTTMNLVPGETMVPLATTLLQNINWNPVDYLITSSSEVSTLFINEASKKEICIMNNVLINETLNLVSGKRVVVVADYADIKWVWDKLDSNTSALLVPLDGVYDYLQGPHRTTLVLLPTRLDVPPIRNPYNISDEDNDLSLVDTLKSKNSLQQLQTVNDILELVRLFKTVLIQYCGEQTPWELCPELQAIPHPPATQLITDKVHRLLAALRFLDVAPSDFDGAYVFEQTSKFERVGSLKVSPEGWYTSLDVNLTGKLLKCVFSPTNDTTTIDCNSCINSQLIQTVFVSDEQTGFYLGISIRSDPWVAAFLTIASVGVLCCITVMIFIIVRMCKKDVLEGNPGFSFLLLLSLVFMYFSIIPFTLELNGESDFTRGLFCGLKVFGTCLSYSLVFSIMLARAIMLASCDDDGGFMSHINGYLQTILCFFIALVQIALTLQFWAINWVLLSKEQCEVMSQGHLFLFLLAYDSFLLLLLFSVSPFVMFSKRNYREGGFYALSTFLCVLIWVSWCTCYVIFPNWRTILVASGLVSTATVILVTVFIPRTYLMLTGIVRDHLVSTLPSLAHTASASVVDVHYRSTQALYDSVNIRGHSNPNFYSERPNTPSTSKMDDRLTVENTYERYDSPPSPRNITRF